jgi:transcriptional regulator with PAS, ATPase and Fis domain
MLDAEHEPNPDSERNVELDQNPVATAAPSTGSGLGGPDLAIDNNAEAILPARASQSLLDTPLPGMIGTNSRIMQPVYRLARLLAPRNTTVLITGPTGCGKEIVARAIHQLSPRAARTFAVVNCAAIPETLLEAELFGYARGAFTGAAQSYAGRIQAAQGGTLFLDEIGEMPLSLQPKLLRFLEQKELQRLGSAEVIHVDARVVSATNAHLLTLVREGKFREDLYYRLSAFPLEIPPLRDRPEDIGQLAEYFLEKYSSNPPAPQLSAAALHFLRTQPWAGNIRELQNVIERALILSEDQPVIRPEHISLGETSLRHCS